MKKLKQALALVLKGEFWVVAQLVERRSVKAVVACSSQANPAKFEGDKMRSDPVTIINAGDASTASIASKGVFLDQLYAFSIQATGSTASVAGNVTLQASNDNVQPVSSGTDPAANVVNWGAFGTGTAAVSGTISTFIDVPQTGIRWVRAIFAKTGTSTGNITVTFNGKG